MFLEWIGFTFFLSLSRIEKNISGKNRQNDDLRVEETKGQRTGGIRWESHCSVFIKEARVYHGLMEADNRGFAILKVSTWFGHILATNQDCGWTFHDLTNDTTEMIVLLLLCNSNYLLSIVRYYRRQFVRGLYDRKASFHGYRRFARSVIDRKSIRIFFLVNNIVNNNVRR